MSFPDRHVGFTPPFSSLLQSAAAEEAANPESHVGMRGVFEGLSTTNAYQAGATADLIVRGASAFYVGATTRSLAARWLEEPSPHCRRWHRMYGLCRFHDGLSLAHAERDLIMRLQGTGRCANKGAGGERLPTSGPSAGGWLYVCVRDHGGPYAM